MKLSHTRAMVRAALDGRLDGAPTRQDPVFGLAIPTAVPDVPSEGLDPRATWADPTRYDAPAPKRAATQGPPNPPAPPAGPTPAWPARPSTCSTASRSSACATSGSWATRSWSI